jgi:ankyrin repeat protein
MMQTPLHWAAKRDNESLIKLLLKYKADVNARDMNGRSPLFLAAKLNNVNAVRVLLANMSNAFSMDKEGTMVQDVTYHPTINNMIQKGKKV